MFQTTSISTIKRRKTFNEKAIHFVILQYDLLFLKFLLEKSFQMKLMIFVRDCHVEFYFSLGNFFHETMPWAVLLLAA